MVYKANALFLCLLGLLLFNSCATTAPTADTFKPDLDKFFERKLQGITTLAAEELTETAVSHSYPFTTFDEIWDSIIKVLVQNGVIVHISKRSRIITAISDMVPFGLDKTQEQYQGFIKPMSPLFNTLHLFVEKASKDEGVITVYLKADRPVSKIFFDKLSTQVYSGQKWKYLYK